MDVLPLVLAVAASRLLRLSVGVMVRRVGCGGMIVRVEQMGRRQCQRVKWKQKPGVVRPLRSRGKVDCVLQSVLIVAATIVNIVCLQVQSWW